MPREGGIASLRAFLLNELSSPTDVKHADTIQLHLRKFLLSQNTFLSIAVVSLKPFAHRPIVNVLVENRVRDDWSLCLDSVRNTSIPLIVVTLAIHPACRWNPRVAPHRSCFLRYSFADSSSKSRNTSAAEAINHIRAGASVLTGIGRTVIYI